MKTDIFGKSLRYVEDEGLEDLERESIRRLAKSRESGTGDLKRAKIFQRK